MTTYLSYKGNTSTSYISPRTNGDGIIEYFIITNKAVGAVTVNVFILTEDDISTNVSPLNLQLQAGECFTDRRLVILSQEKINVTASASVDFYFSIVLNGDTSA